MAAAPGIALGRVMRYHRGMIRVPLHRIQGADVAAELAALAIARKKSQQELKKLSASVSKKLGEEHGEIFRAHELILSDPVFEKEVESKIRKRRLNAAWAVSESTQEILAAFRGAVDPYLLERAGDVQDVSERLIRQILGAGPRVVVGVPPKTIVVAKDLLPSDGILLSKNVVALATDMGGPTGHTAILARALNIPAVVGLTHVMDMAEDRNMMIVDGARGIVTLRPNMKHISDYRKQRRKISRENRELETLRDLPARTQDGLTLELSANVELPVELSSVSEYGASGIGLFRTEYMFLNRSTLPNEEEQMKAFQEACRAIPGGGLIIRTLDIGGDKLLGGVGLETEDNPSLGLRGVRLSLARRGLFQTQIKAILRASAHGNIRIMFPLVSGPGELRRVLNIYEGCCNELKRKKIPFDKSMEVGIMIEVPSAALMAEDLGRMVNFFSIGSNDLIQYTLAVDRVNEAVAYLYDPFHPAVWRLIHSTVEGARRAGIRVNLCGEIAADPRLAPILVGLGINGLSMTPSAIPAVKRAIRDFSFTKATRLATRVLASSSSSEVRRLLSKFLNR